MPGPDRADAVLTIDLDAVVANWGKLQRMVEPALCAAVVKADAYGLGADRVAPALAAAGCRSFYVAQLDEGTALRRYLPAAEIAVFDGVLPGTEAEFAQHRLVPVLNGLEQIERWAGFARGSRELPAILHLDTGLNRLGLSPGDVERLAEEPRRLAGLTLHAVISHLACADRPADPMNTAQLESFRRLHARLPPARASVASSSAIFLGPAFHLDEVRPGAALYGIRPLPNQANPMAQVIALHAQILQVREVDSPMTVGYGATHRVRRPSRIATVGVGYADGYFRALSNRSLGFIGDHPAPLVGRVSMDLITLDVTDVPAGLARPGARVELVGPHRALDQIAADAGTIDYEILTSLGMGRRFHRRYLGGEA
jgi:alanine racemase